MPDYNWSSMKQCVIYFTLHGFRDVSAAMAVGTVFVAGWDC